jgi:Type I phosphodiesterase / nucleotide pyrophosphatase
VGSGRSVRIFVLIDALGWALVEKKDFLRDFLPYQQPLRTVLGYSSGAIPSILTGRFPADHGHWNLMYRDRAGSPFRWLRFFRFVPARLLDNRIGRKLLKEMGRRLLGLGPLFEVCVSPRLLPWFNWTEKRNIYAPRGIAVDSIFDRLEREGIPHRVYSYHSLRDEEILERARRDLEGGATGFFFLYLSEMDRFLHHHCETDASFDERLDWYARGLRKMFEAARALDPGAQFTAISDHGMTPVRHVGNLVGEVEQLGLSMPRDYLAVYDSTMARFWFSGEAARRRVLDRLRAIPYGRVLDDQELDRLGILFPDRRYGELVFLLEPGWLIGGSDFNGRGWAPAGMHGYHPDDPYSDGIFLSSRRPSSEVRSLVDVYPLMVAAAQATMGSEASRA